MMSKYVMEKLERKRTKMALYFAWMDSKADFGGGKPFSRT